MASKPEIIVDEVAGGKWGLRLIGKGGETRVDCRNDEERRIAVKAAQAMAYAILGVDWIQPTETYLDSDGHRITMPKGWWREWKQTREHSPNCGVYHSRQYCDCGAEGWVLVSPTGEERVLKTTASRLRVMGKLYS